MSLLTRLLLVLAGLGALRASATAQTGASPEARAQASQAHAPRAAALRALVDSAAERNRLVPPGLGGYRARLESEISIGNRRAEGMEMALSLEQVATTLTWDRTGAYTQEVVGYRTQAIAANPSTLGFFRSGWAIPSLYGNRLALLFGRDTSEAGARRSQRQGRDPLFAVHPLAADRARYYRFSGGDTVQILRTASREVQIVRVSVTLAPDVPDRSVVFVGDLDLDANRYHLVRMRGYFAVVGGPKPRFDLVRDAGLQGIAYVEAVNAEVEGSFWLPAYQRFEAQATSPTVGESRAVFRIVTQVRDRELFRAPAGVEVGSPGDTLAVRPFRLIVGAPDSVSAFRDWAHHLGEMTAETSAEDFNDVAPDRFNPAGPARARLETERFGDFLHVNRVEGIFTGLGGVMRFRDAAPGVTVRAALGYAWQEGTARGRLVVERRRAQTQLALRLQRSLDLTNDFRSPFDSGSTLGAVFGRDNYDYVDRRTATVQLLRLFGDRGQGQFRVETGLAEDRATTAHLSHALIGGRTFARANRAITPGTYQRTLVTLDLRPDVTLEYLRPGLGARMRYERGDGALTYQRAEARLTARTNRGPLTYAARLDLGVTTPNAPPQQLFELGQNQNLPGYGYKEFAGDQAVVARTWVAVSLPIWRAPVHVVDRVWLPPIAPAVALGVQSGWTRASTADALATVTALGSVPTGHPRTSASLTLRAFGGAIGVGIARTLDQPGPVRWIVEFGQRP